MCTSAACLVSMPSVTCLSVQELRYDVEISVITSCYRRRKSKLPNDYHSCVLLAVFVVSAFLYNLGLLLRRGAQLRPSAPQSLSSRSCCARLVGSLLTIIMLFVAIALYLIHPHVVPVIHFAPFAHQRLNAVFKTFLIGYFCYFRMRKRRPKAQRKRWGF